MLTIRQYSEIKNEHSKCCRFSLLSVRYTHNYYRTESAEPLQKLAEKTINYITVGKVS